MITLSHYHGKTVGVFGLGKAGEATVAALLAGGARVFAWDDKPCVARKDAAVLAPFDNWPWQELAALVLAPGVPLTHPEPHAVVKKAQAHGCPVLGDVELLCVAQPEARFVGITGTNGKSTTTTLIGHILQQAGIPTQVGGNLGTAALSLAPLGKGGVYVIETSSYQLDLLHAARFHVALLLNVTPDHLDRHGDMQGYIAAKMHIFDRQQAGDVAIVAVDDEHTRAVAEVLKKRAADVVEVSAQQRTRSIFVEDGVLHDMTEGGDRQFDLRGIVTLTGRHNWQNAAIAYAAARRCGVSPEVIYAAMQSFGGLRHRLQQVAEIDGVRFVNDSKATNADATQNALLPYDAIYWIAGGKAKAGGIESLSPLFSHITHAFLIGDAQEMFAQTLEGKVPYTRSMTLDNAVTQAAAMAFAEGRKGAVVLLSPACASFDQFNSFEHRGDVFCELVEKLKGAQRHAV
jgi:UDP-N-acetylmuramoylalanine--D-glutamate ligase